jgi:hypothetical protein
MILDCNNYIQTTCQFYLLLEDNGNMVIVKGKDTSENKGVIWSSDTTNKNIDINSEWIATKGKYGRNYLKMGETLAMGEWIGSSNGSTKLIMELDGNLVLYAAKNSDGCKKFNDKILGGSNINSVYKLNEKGNINNLGKIGYVDHNSTLREYPKSMINFSNTYQTYKHTNSPGNDIKSIITTDQTDCEQSCNNTSDCAGYVYQSDNKTCVLKKENNFIKETNNNFTLGVRDKSLINNSSCSNQMINVDTLEYSNYIKGDDMNSDINCSESIMNPEDKHKLDTIKNKIDNIIQIIATKTTHLKNTNSNIYDQIKVNSQQYQKNLEKYNILNKKLNEVYNKENMSKKESMKNYSSSLNNEDISKMISDSDIIVLQENYRYILWSILAVGVLTITLNTMNK